MKILSSKTAIDKSEVVIHDDPKQWRAALDPKTGKTYWYHRIRRISTWVKPVFISDLHQVRLNGNNLKDPLSSFDLDYNQAIEENDNLMKNEFYDRRSSNEIKIVHNAICNEVGDKSQQMQQEEQGGQYNADQPKDRLSDSLSSDNSIAASISNAVSCLTSIDEYSRIDAMLLLSSRCCIDGETSIQLAQTENLLDNLVVIISGGESKKCRRSSLKILCLLALCDEDKVKEAFYGNQSWVMIIEKFEQWNDDESIFLYCILVSLLEKGPAQAVMSREMKKRLEDWVLQLLESYDRDADRKDSFDLLSIKLLSVSTYVSSSFRSDDWRVLYSLYLTAEGMGEPDTLSSSLPALSLLFILTHIVHSYPSGNIKKLHNLIGDTVNEMENRVPRERMINEQLEGDVGIEEQIMKSGGGSTCLLGLCTARSIDQVVRFTPPLILLSNSLLSLFLLSYLSRFLFLICSIFLASLFQSFLLQSYILYPFLSLLLIKAVQKKAKALLLVGMKHSESLRER